MSTFTSLPPLFFFSLFSPLFLSLSHTHTHKNAAVEVANVTTGLGEDTSFFCNVTGVAEASIGFEWFTTQNGVYQATQFPMDIFGDRIRGPESSKLNIMFVGRLDDDFGYACNVTVTDMLIASRIAFLTVNSKQHVHIDGILTD